MCINYLRLIDRRSKVWNIISIIARRDGKVTIGRWKLGLLVILVSTT